MAQVPIRASARWRKLGPVDGGVSIKRITDSQRWNKNDSKTVRRRAKHINALEADSKLLDLHVALLGAARDGDISKARELLDSGVSVNCRAPHSSLGLPGTKASPLHHACIADHHPMAALLLDRGAHTELRDCDDCTPLILAAMLERPKIARLLLSKGANIEARGSNQQTALHKAALFGSPEVAAVLCSHNVDRAAKDANGKTPLDLATFSGADGVLHALRNVHKLKHALHDPRIVAVIAHERDLAAAGAAAAKKKDEEQQQQQQQKREKQGRYDEENGAVNSQTWRPNTAVGSAPSVGSISEDP